MQFKNAKTPVMQVKNSIILKCIKNKSMCKPTNSHSQKQSKLLQYAFSEWTIWLQTHTNKYPSLSGSGI